MSKKKIRTISSDLKQEKDNLQEFITDYMDKNNMKDKNILINDGKLQYSQSKSTQPLKKYVIDRLTLYFNNSEKAEAIANLLYDIEKLNINQH